MGGRRKKGKEEEEEEEEEWGMGWGGGVWKVCRGEKVRRQVSLGVMGWVGRKCGVCGNS